MYIIDGETYEEVDSQLNKALDDMNRIISQGGTNNGMVDSCVSFSNPNHPDHSIHDRAPGEELGGFALVINGHRLVSHTIIDH